MAGASTTSLPRTGEYKVIYVYTIDDGRHDGRVKVGDATYHTDESITDIIESANAHQFSDPDRGLYTTDGIIAAAHRRINEQTGTADVAYDLLFTALAVKPAAVEGRYDAFRDYDVHKVLIRSGFEKNFHRDDKKVGEWFVSSTANAVNAIAAVIAGQDRITDADTVIEPVTFRTEQRNAIDSAASVLSKGRTDKPASYLWNAIMRFGKTISAYGLIDSLYPAARDHTAEGNKTGHAPKVLILTHRPVVGAGWSEDFVKFFGVDSSWQFGARRTEIGISWDEIDQDAPFIYFASIQDLRGSFTDSEDITPAEVGEDAEATLDEVFTKNATLFGTTFDLVIVDESHEGTQTFLANRMMESITSAAWLHLSGTPFNIVDKFGGNVFNWTYSDERGAFKAWEDNPENASLTNPYGHLPTLEIRTYDVEKVLAGGNKPHNGNGETSFSFSRFFATENSTRKGRVYPSYAPFSDPRSVATLLNRIFTNDEYEDAADRRAFPFSRDDAMVDFAHTFWVLPSVAACTALHEMLAAQYPHFTVVNATADNDGGDALGAVRKAIRENERTITLSISKLTTGTTIPEWTGVFMLSNMSSPAQYLQTIFRSKSPGSLSDGRAKTTGVVFDFAPDRALEMISRAAQAQVSITDGKTYEQERDERRSEVEKFLSYLPIIAYDGARFTTTDTDALMRRLDRVFIAEAVSTGFASSHMFDFDIHGITDADAALMNELKAIVSKAGHEKVRAVTISASSLTGEAEKAKDAKTDADATVAEKTAAEKAREEALAKAEADRRNAYKMMDVLRGVSVRIPMLVFAADTDEAITVDNFASLIDDASWGEFMPNGFTKEAWGQYNRFFNKVIFEGACDEVRRQAKAMDAMAPLDRVVALAHLFSTFKNPDKETILTPWKVVNRHTADTLGGLRWVDEYGDWYCSDGDAHSHEDIVDSIGGEGELVITPKWVNGPDAVAGLFDREDATFCDINSKTALYPLYVAASLLWRKTQAYQEQYDAPMDEAQQWVQWNRIISNQVFVNCRVPYSRAIATRVLAGYTGVSINASVVDILDVKEALDCATVDNSKGKAKRLTDETKSALMTWVFNGKGTNVDGSTLTPEDKAAMLLSGDVSNAITLMEAVEDGAEVTGADNAAADSVDEDASTDDGKKTFDVILSNPPYQIENGGSAVAIYHRFMELSQTLAKNVSMVYPVRWVTGGHGEGLDEFRARELTSTHYVRFTVDSGENSLFENVAIKGGTCYFLWSEAHDGNIDYSYNGATEYRPSLLNGLPVMVMRNDFSRIVQKVSVTLPIKPFGADFYGRILRKASDIEKLAEGCANGLTILYSGKGGGIKSITIPNDSTVRDTSGFKVFASKTSDPSNGSLRRWNRALVGGESTITSNTFIQVGRYATEDEANRALFYLKTDFATFLHGVITPTQDATSKTYRLIPDVDFATGEIKDKPGTFLDFTDPTTLDDQLALIYELTPDERSLMAASIKPWKDKYSLTADGLF